MTDASPVRDSRPEDLVRASERLLAAIVSRDAAVLEELVAPEFAHFDASGTRTERRDFIAQVLGSTYTVVHAGFESLAVDVVGELAVVNGVQRAEVDLGAGESVVSRGAFTDVFVATPSGWRIRLARSVELDTAGEQGAK
jgi:ketosteroid isomerase-like protein